MKSLRLSMKKTKKGAASLYVVVFATILFGVITVSFARIILSEASQSSNDDLSRSAYDAALAGVEDAKITVNKYYNCLKSGGDCSQFNIFTDPNDPAKHNCENGFPLGKLMHQVDGEVLIQETQIGSNAETAADQAYTCVLVSDVVPDYRGTLTTDTRTKVIPININGAGTGSQSQLANVKKIRFSWFSTLNQGENKNNFNTSSGNDETAKFKTQATTPPTIALTFIKTGSTINLNELRKENNSGGNIDSTMILLPSDKSGNEDHAGRTILNGEVFSAGDAERGGASLMNNPFTVKCSNEKEFACNVDLEVSGTSFSLSSSDNVFLVAALPYGDAFTDFAVTLLDNNGKEIPLRGVQVSVDSTGRTNQLVRRVETRLDPADMFFPYPQYALELSGGSGDHALAKNFWVTANCWYSTPQSPSSLKAGLCANNGTL